MTPYEMMLSESQERMLMVLKPGREAEAEAIFRKWELDFAVIGEVTDTGHMVLELDGEVVCDIPLGPLADEAPLYERPSRQPRRYKAWAGVKPLADVPESTDIAADLLKLMGSPNLASRRWIWEQYDQSVGADTVQRPGGDAAVVRVHGTEEGAGDDHRLHARAIATPTRIEGGKQAIAEAYRNLCAVGAKPLAVTNCLNFGNPQRPEIMAQFVGCLEGMGDACRALDFPIVSGNVALYNESKATGGGSAILPTPAIGGVGLLDDWEKTATIAFKAEGETLVLLGHSTGHVGQSLWLDVCHGRREAPPPPVDLAVERRLGELRPHTDRRRAGHRGPRLQRRRPAGRDRRNGAGRRHRRRAEPAQRRRIPAAILFGEDQGRPRHHDDPDAVIAAATAANLFAAPIGTLGGDSVVTDRGFARDRSPTSAPRMKASSPS